MKKIYLFILVFFIFISTGFSQKNPSFPFNGRTIEYGKPLEIYVDTSINNEIFDFPERFPKEGTNEKIYELQKYIFEKEKKILKNKYLLEKENENESLTNIYLEMIKDVENISQDIITKNISLAENTLNEINKRITKLEENIFFLTKDIEYAERDIIIENDLRVKEDKFFRAVSSNTFWLIGIIMAIFFIIPFLLVILKGQNNTNLKDNLLKNWFSSLGLKFITLFVIIITIILFAILKIESEALITIIASIAGYILGTVGRDAIKNKEQSKPDSIIQLEKKLEQLEKQGIQQKELEQVYEKDEKQQ